jgi:hypothetical protein
MSSSNKANILAIYSLKIVFEHLIKKVLELFDREQIGADIEHANILSPMIWSWKQRVVCGEMFDRLKSFS